MKRLIKIIRLCILKPYITKSSVRCDRRSNNSRDVQFNSISFVFAQSKGIFSP